MDVAGTVGTSHVAPIAIRAVTLEVVGGPNIGQKARLTSPAVLIGTGDRADFRLTDPGVSREHVRMQLSDTGVSLRDEKSRNGTWLGGVRLHHAIVTADALLQLGSTTLKLVVEPETSDVMASSGDRFGAALGSSAAMRVIFGTLHRAAGTDLSILLEGESGVGKEVLARSIHDASVRAEGPFVAVDCGAIPAQLLESELFGHVKGSFTGAQSDRIGLFAEADRGTIFLDEIGELPLDLQPKLLRALEAREVRQVGSNTPRKVDVRVVAATNRSLAGAVEQGIFRQDLLYRLSVLRVTVPPLRDRREDIPMLARSFLVSLTGDANSQLPPDVEGMLAAYEWPGNVRELRNAVQRFAALGVRDRASVLGYEVQSVAMPPKLGDLTYHEARQRVLDEFERVYVRDVLDKCGGVIVKAAEKSGVARASFYRMLERLGMK